jgi:hypothetical protein
MISMVANPAAIEECIQAPCRNPPQHSPEQSMGCMSEITISDLNDKMPPPVRGPTYMYLVHIDSL